MVDRSSRREVRNPLLALPGTRALLSLPPDQRALLARLAGDIAVDARSRAQASWLKNKGPMAAYWKAVGAYTGHLARVLKRGLQ